MAPNVTIDHPEGLASLKTRKTFSNFHASRYKMVNISEGATNCRSAGGRRGLEAIAGRWLPQLRPGQRRQRQEHQDRAHRDHPIDEKHRHEIGRS